ncbi:MAG: MurNAc alpha-1-phosphate uridylyltransferase [Dinoroseobacter sp.]|jgi:MurNAc alpha-1-phosphate uridylyltransferase
MKAMILAAGRGERMMPLTRHCPKPLLPIGDTTLIQRHLLRLAEAGVQSAVINVHFLAEQIQSQLGSEQYGLKLEYSIEPELLETAGGIQAALPLLGDEPFLVVNGDIYTDFDFCTLLDRTEIGKTKSDLPHLVMVPNPEHHPKGDYGVHASGQLLFTGPKYTYSGIGLYNEAFFSNIKPGKLNLRPLFDQAVETGRLKGEVYTGYWTDVGTPGRYEALTLKLS